MRLSKNGKPLGRPPKYVVKQRMDGARMSKPAKYVKAKSDAVQTKYVASTRRDRSNASKLLLQQEKGKSAVPKKDKRKLLAGSHPDKQSQRNHNEVRDNPELREPALTKELAFDVARFLAAGIPIKDILRYSAPEYFERIGKLKRLRWGRDWLNSMLVLDAVNELNGGKWSDLDADRRLEVAIERHMAQLAYFLYSHDYARLYGPDLEKADTARDALVKHLEGADHTSSPFNDFLQDVLQGKVKIEGVPIMEQEPVTTVPADLAEAVKKRMN